MKCSQVGCEETAAWTYVWPGRAERTWACFPHLSRAHEIAKTMGFSLGDVRVCTIDELCRNEGEKTP